MLERLKRRKTWAALLIGYLIFFLWYTPLGGPLSQAEIIEYEAKLRARGQDPQTIQVLVDFMRSDTGNDFAMLNALDLREFAAAEAGLPPGTSGAEATALYTEPFLSRALRNAAHPVMVGQAAAAAVDVWGIDGATQWDQGALVRYRSRRDLMDQVVFLLDQAAAGDDLHRFKIAGLEKTIAYPLDPWFQLGDPRLLLGLLFLIIGFARSAIRSAQSNHH